MEFTNGKKVDLTEIHKLEQKLGVKFPNDYTKCLLKNSGAFVFPDAFYIGEDIESINNLFSVEKMLQEVELTENGIVPIARDAGGNNICFDFKKNCVVFWDHEIDECKKICETFTEFLSLLFEEDE